MTFSEPEASVTVTRSGPLKPVDPDNPPGPRFYVLYILATFGIWLSATTPASVTLAVRAAEIDPEGAAQLLAVVVGVGGLLAIPLAPVMGALSDRSRSRFGRRRPFIILGATMQFAGALVIAGFAETPMLMLGWGLIQCGNSVAVSPLWAVIADRVPVHRQGLISGLAATALNLSTLIGTFIIAAVGNTFLMLFIPGAVGLVFSLVFVLAIKERRMWSHGTRAAGIGAAFKSLMFNPSRERNLTFAIIAVIALTGGVCTTSFVLYFIESYLGTSPETALSHFLVFTVIVTVFAMIGAPVAGRLSDKLGRPRSVFAAGVVLTMAGLAIMVAIPSLPGFFFGSIVLGLGSGVHSGQSVALVIAIGEEATVGRNLGLVGLAQQLPFTVLPLFAPFLLGIGSPNGDNFPALWLFGIVFAFLALPALAVIRIPQRA